LLALPLDLKAAQYCQGGPEAQLHLHSGPAELECVGSLEPGFLTNDTTNKAWPVPNVVGIVRVR